jgi:hypothetical protein
MDSDINRISSAGEIESMQNHSSTSRTGLDADKQYNDRRATSNSSTPNTSPVSNAGSVGTNNSARNPSSNQNNTTTASDVATSSNTSARNTSTAHTTTEDASAKDYDTSIHRASVVKPKLSNGADAFPGAYDNRHIRNAIEKKEPGGVKGVLNKAV